MTLKFINAITITIATCLIGFSSYANNEPTLIKMHATAYCLEGTTASGIQTREGIAAAKREWIGKTAIIYQRLPDNKVGKVIGIYEIEDTGTTKGLTSGSVIDVWCSDMDNCQLFMNEVYKDGCNGKVFVEILDARG